MLKEMTYFEYDDCRSLPLRGALRNVRLGYIAFYVSDAAGNKVGFIPAKLNQTSLIFGSKAGAHP